MIHLIHLLFALVLNSVYNVILTITPTTINHMSNSKRKSNRRPAKFYKLRDAYGRDVNIDLNNYKVTCNKTGKLKSFYHKYLHNMIVTKYNSNIDLFREGYVSREAGPSAQARKVAAALEATLDKLYDGGEAS